MSSGNNIEKEAVTVLLRRCRNQTRLKVLKSIAGLVHSTTSAWKGSQVKGKN